MRAVFSVIETSVSLCDPSLIARVDDEWEVFKRSDGRHAWVPAEFAVVLATGLQKELLRVLQECNRISKIALSELRRLLPRVVLVLVVAFEGYAVEDALLTVNLMLVFPDRKLQGAGAGLVHRVGLF
jgi:hypothetical protein